MTVETPTEFPIHPLLQKRFSPRTFANRAVPASAIRSLLEAARWAASSYNEQPWAFFVAESGDAEAFETLLSCLVPGNQAWASSAPLLMLSVARTNFSRNQKANRHAFHDVGLAVAQMTLQATSMDLAVHQMAGFDLERARESYAVPKGYEPVAALAIGYPGDPETLPEELKRRELAPRSRKAQSEFAFAKHWGASFEPI